ncbi:DUF4158 domain-containing protein [Streptosporangium sp. NPDC049376]|uniref:DUF4158 domain-containing protein n=1 Tax=Streptosporangium sp. NPDC049376 TaxID=3366192 RepID=UPI0037BC99E5
MARAAERLGVSPAVLASYGQRAQTRSDHLVKIAEYLEWKSAPAGGQEMKELEQFLLDRAMEHDSPSLLFNLAREYLMAAKVIRTSPPRERGHPALHLTGIHDLVQMVTPEHRD